MVFPDGTHALDDVSISIERGEFVTVVGPSGCGKSTLLRIASGLETHTGGECDVDRDSIGYVFQDATLFPWRTVRRNVELIAELHGINSAAMAPRVDESLELVGLKEHELKYPKQLSGGMKMRASLARSLVLQPDVFLFDEPFGALDEISRERLNDELLSLFKAKNFAGLFITHSIAEACSSRPVCWLCRLVPAASWPTTRCRSSIPASTRSDTIRRLPNCPARSPTTSAERTREHRQQRLRDSPATGRSPRP